MRCIRACKAATISIVQLVFDTKQLFLKQQNNNRIGEIRNRGTILKHTNSRNIYVYLNKYTDIYQPPGHQTHALIRGWIPTTVCDSNVSHACFFIRHETMFVFVSEKHFKFSNFSVTTLTSYKIPELLISNGFRAEEETEIFAHTPTSDGEFVLYTPVVSTHKLQGRYGDGVPYGDWDQQLSGYKTQFLSSDSWEHSAPTPFYLPQSSLWCFYTLTDCWEFFTVRMFRQKELMVGLMNTSLLISCPVHPYCEAWWCSISVGLFQLLGQADWPDLRSTWMEQIKPRLRPLRTSDWTKGWSIKTETPNTHTRQLSSVFQTTQ